jgi:hypothetical protein
MEQMAAAIRKAAPVPLKTSRFPFIFLRAYGLIDPVIREVAKMRYIWRHPLRLTDERLEALLGPGFNTPFETAVAATLAPFVAPLESQSSSDALGRLA